MGKKTVECLPARREFMQEQKTRVAAYCRVSTNLTEQENSFASQQQYYTSYIGGKPDWTFAGIYADKGVSGTRMENRPNFQRMLADCAKGRIDLILTKSISRFSRNTVELLRAVRLLKNMGVAVYFEKESINTLSASGELLLTILGAVAQAEAEAVSSNLRWSIRRRFETGTFRQCAALGYVYDATGQLVIHEAEAEIVRLIFQSYLRGMGTTAIAKILNQKGIQGRKGAPFNDALIRYILKNELYTGDLLCQKTFTTQLPEKRRKRNRGEQQQYLIENDHAAIISKADFQAAQKIMAHRGQNLHNGRRYLFSGKIICGNCGGVFCRREVSGEVFWLCGNHIKRKSCGQALGGKIREKDIQKVFVRLCGKLPENRGILEDMYRRFAEVEAVLQQFEDSSDLLSKIEAPEKQEQALSQMLGDGYPEPAFYIPEKNRIRAELAAPEAQWHTSDEDTELWNYAEKTRRLLSMLTHHGEAAETFAEALFVEIVEQIIVDSQTEIRFRLTNGLCIQESIE